MAQHASRRMVAAAALGGAILISSLADNAEARSGGGRGQQSHGAQSGNNTSASSKAKWNRAPQQVDKHNASIAKPAGSTSVRKKCPSCENEEPKIQR